LATLKVRVSASVVAAKNQVILKRGGQERVFMKDK